MEQQPTKEPSKTLIYVSNLAYDTTDEEFQNLFKEFKVKTAYIAKRRNGRSKGFGFVNFESENDQKLAIQKIEGNEFRSRKLGAKVAFNDNRRTENGELRDEFKTQTQSNQTPSDTVVHVSNISWSLRTQDLVEIFEKIGLKPKFARIARRFGRSRGYGFLEFNTKEEQEKALTLNGTKHNDREISVKPSTNFRPPRTNNPQTKRLPNGNNKENKNLKVVRRTERVNENTLYIKNLPFELDNEDLKSIFQEFHATNANIVSNPRNGRSRGYGFVEFNNPKERDEALKALDQSEVNGRVITIKVSNGERTTRRSSRTRSNNRSRSNNRRNNNNNNNNNNRNRNRSSSRNRNNNRNENRRTNQRERNNNENREVSPNMVYVSNLPFVVEDKEFGEIFSNLKFNNAYIARRRNGNSKGFGFIEFASTEDQQNALKLNGRDVRGRNIVVQAAFKNDRNQQK